MFIRSERLFLRPGWPEDWQEVLDLIRDEEIVRNLASVPWPYLPEHARDLASKSQERWLPNFFVTRPGASGADLIGCAGIVRHHGEVELGYWIARDHWGQGYATEAVRAVLDVAQALGHRRIVASHFRDNPASGRVLLKAGFRKTGKEVRRFSQARGEHVASVQFAIDPSDRKGGGPDEELAPARMAA